MKIRGVFVALLAVALAPFALLGDGISRAPAPFGGLSGDRLCTTAAGLR